MRDVIQMHPGNCIRRGACFLEFDPHQKSELRAISSSAGSNFTTRTFSFQSLSCESPNFMAALQ